MKLRAQWGMRAGDLLVCPYGSFVRSADGCFDASEDIASRLMDAGHATAYGPTAVIVPICEEVETELKSRRARRKPVDVDLMNSG